MCVIGSVTTIRVNFVYYFLKGSDSLWPSSSKIFTLILNFAAIFPYIGQCLQLGRSCMLFVDVNANI
jgi:hypothetical protein